MFMRAYNTWLERRVDLACLQFLPVDVAEERMRSDGAVRTCRHSETRGRIPIQKLQQPNSPIRTIAATSNLQTTLVVQVEQLIQYV